MPFLKNNKINVIHDESKTRLYIIYRGILGRCFNSKNNSYKYYGGRGITVCPEWTNDYIVFRDWSLSNGYKEGLEIDRIEDNGNYEPSNCSWVTIKENNRKRKCIKLNLKKANEIRELYNTGKYTQKEIGLFYNICGQAVSQIVTNKIWK